MSTCCSNCFRPKLSFSILISVGIIAFYYLLTSLHLFSFSVSSTSSLFAFFIFGIIAGFSTCSPITGTLFVSFLPHRRQAVLFLISRLLAFVIFGALLGFLGNYFRFSIQYLDIFSIFVNLIILFVSFSLLRLISFKNFNVSSKSPVIAGILTFFLPCGFTLTAQSLALASGSPLSSLSILFVFCLGTITPLFFLFFTPKKIINNSRFSAYFTQVLGILLLVFSLYSLQNRFFPISFPSLVSNQDKANLSTQNVLKMIARADGYTPNFFRVKAGELIRWEITDMGTGGCTNAIIARSLFTGVINLIPGTTSVKEFTAPTTPGTYRFSCWMGMISGTIEVVK